jgi:hypothetical protein
MSVGDGVAHIWVPLAQVRYFVELKTSVEKQFVEAAMCAVLAVTDVRHRYEVKRPASATGEAQVGGAAR